MRVAVYQTRDPRQKAHDVPMNSCPARSGVDMNAWSFTGSLRTAWSTIERMAVRKER